MYIYELKLKTLGEPWPVWNTRKWHFRSDRGL